MANLKQIKFDGSRKIEVGKTYPLTREHDTRTLTIRSIWSDRYTTMIDVVTDNGQPGESYPNTLYYQIDWERAAA